MIEKSVSRRQAGYQLLRGYLPSQKKTRRKTPKEKEYVNIYVGALMWVATMTRSNIACALRAVTRFCESPELVHKKAIWKIMQSLLHTKERRITYGGQGCELNTEA